MNKILIALATAATVAAGTVAVPDTADARCRFNCGLAIGLGAAVIGGALLAPRYRSYGVVEGYDPYPAYYAGPPVDCPGGYWARRCRATDGYGNCVSASKPRFFCPAGY
jgi:hypothetical protein